MTTPTTASVPAVAFVATEAFVEALDLAAGQAGLTRSHYARDLIAKHLRSLGILPSDTALTRAATRRRLLTEKRARIAARGRA